MKVQYSLAIAGVVFTFSEISCSETRMFYVRNTRMSDAIKDKGAIFKRIINYLNFSWNVIKERFSKSESPFILTESILECYIEWERLRDLSNLAGVIRHKECRDVHYQTKGGGGSSLSKKNHLASFFLGTIASNYITYFVVILHPGTNTLLLCIKHISVRGIHFSFTKYSDFTSRIELRTHKGSVCVNLSSLCLICIAKCHREKPGRIYLGTKREMTRGVVFKRECSVKNWCHAE